MDVVYVHKQKASDEIRWSIESVKKNLEHRNIYVIGDDPGVKGVIVVKPKVNRWSTLSKYHDSINKYLTACEHSEISEQFLAMNDDFFILQPWTPVVYHRGTLADHVRSRYYNGVYTRSLDVTRRYLDSTGKQTLSFELHIPMLFEKKKLKALIGSMQLQRSRIYQLRSLYGNTYDVPATYRDDVKNTPDFIGSDLLSTTEDYFKNKPIGEYIRSKL
jgi:hypothetical protein